MTSDRSTKNTPSGNEAGSRATTASASAVLPHPTGPTTVTSGRLSTAWWTRSMSSSRPISAWRRRGISTRGAADRRADVGCTSRSASCSEDLLVEVPELGSGLDTELIGQQGGRLPMRGQRGARSAGSVEAEDLLAPQPFVERVLGERDVDLAGGLLWRPERQQGADATPLQCESLLAELGSGRLQPTVVVDVVRPASPQAERRRRRLEDPFGFGALVHREDRGGCRGDQPRVDRSRRDAQAVAELVGAHDGRRCPGRSVGFEDPPQAPDQRVQRRRGLRQRLGAPDAVDQPLHPRRLAASDEER